MPSLASRLFSTAKKCTKFNFGGPYHTACGTFPARNWTHTPCTGSSESEPLDYHGSPRFSYFEMAGGKIFCDEWKLECQCPHIKFSWNPGALGGLHVVYVPLVTQLLNCGGVRVAWSSKLKIFTVFLSTGKVFWPLVSRAMNRLSTKRNREIIHWLAGSEKDAINSGAVKQEVSTRRAGKQAHHGTERSPHHGA